MPIPAESSYLARLHGTFEMFKPSLNRRETHCS